MCLIVILSMSGCASIEQPVIAPLKNQEMRVHFLDVGQADSILIQLPNQKVMLIDGGNRDDGKGVVKYIKSAGINKIDYIVATHPHEDHIGGLIEVVKSISFDKIYMPKTPHVTETFKQFIQEIINSGKNIHRARTGVTICQEDELKIRIIATVGEHYEKLNNYSTVIKIDYKNVGFLFMGDAEIESEAQLDPIDLSAQVLKVGHHGSSSATSLKLLNHVNPKIAVISAGKANDYGHPHQKTISLLESKRINILRTDKNGVIILTTNGDSIESKVSKDKH